MAKFTVFKLKFRSSFHLSTNGFADENSDVTIHSDTMYSAICHAMGMLYGSQVVSDFIASQSIRISSCFPYFNDDLYFPRPLNSLKGTLDNATSTQRKSLKKVKFLSKQEFEKALRGNLTFEDLYSKNKAELPSFFKKQEIPRVTIDRVSNAASIFNFEQVVFQNYTNETDPSKNKQSGLYFMVDYKANAEKFKVKFEAALRLLGDEGIGADNTVGKGLFRVTKLENELELDCPTNASNYMLLSLYSPSDEELKKLKADECSYEYITRNGWSSVQQMNQRRYSVRMLCEGSVVNYPVEGENKIVLASSISGAPFDVFRYGQTISLPILL